MELDGDGSIPVDFCKDAFRNNSDLGHAFDVFGPTRAALLSNTRSERLGSAKATVGAFFALSFPYCGRQSAD